MGWIKIPKYADKALATGALLLLFGDWVSILAGGNRRDGNHDLAEENFLWHDCLGKHHIRI